jgi:hypothetical protein
MSEIVSGWAPKTAFQAAFAEEGRNFCYIARNSIPVPQGCRATVRSDSRRGCATQPRSGVKRGFRLRANSAGPFFYLCAAEQAGCRLSVSDCHFTFL